MICRGYRGFWVADVILWFIRNIHLVIQVTKILLLLLLFSRSVMSDSLWPHGLQHAMLPYPSPSPGACSSSCPLSWWCHLTISSSVVPFSSCLQSFPASGAKIYFSYIALKTFFFNGKIIALQNFVVFCHTSTRISHRYTHVPSLLNLIYSLCSWILALRF